MTANDIHQALRRDLFPEGKFVYLKEFRAGTGIGGLSERYLDAFVMCPFPSTPMARTAIEIKISRSDFHHEKRRPGKRDPAMHISNQFYFAAPKGLLTDRDVPETCGLIEVGETGETEITIKAPWRDNLPHWPFVASLARRIEELEEQLKAQQPMRTLEKLAEYKKRLQAWKSDIDNQVPGASDVPEPQPKDYGIHAAHMKFMADKMREEVLG